MVVLAANLDGLIKNMNDRWVRLSKETYFATLSQRLQYLDKHEVWLDALNLHETSWILFADRGSHRDESFGWPRKN